MLRPKGDSPKISHNGILIISNENHLRGSLSWNLSISLNAGNKSPFMASALPTIKALRLSHTKKETARSPEKPELRSLCKQILVNFTNLLP